MKKIKVIILINTVIFFVSLFYILTGVSSYLQKSIFDLDAHSYGFSIINALGVALVFFVAEFTIHLFYKKTMYRKNSKDKYPP